MKAKKLFFMLILLMLTAVLATACGGAGKNQPYNENLLKNPGFEESTGTTVTGWDLDRYDTAPPAEYYGAVALSDAPGGNNVLKIESPEYNDARFIQKVAVTGDSYYCLTARVKTENVVNRSSASGANICFLQTYCRSDFVTSATDWQTVTVYGKTEKNAKEVTVALRLGYYSADSQGTAYFDDVSFTRVESLPQGVSAESMATFEFSSSNDTDSEGDTTLTKGKVLANSVLGGIISFAVVLAFAYWAVKGLKLKIRDAYILIVIALVLRMILSTVYLGFKVDVDCFYSWGSIMREYGLKDFYTASSFCDYPPLYMIVCGIISAINKLFGFQPYSAGMLILLKLPATLADLGAAILIMNIAKKHTSQTIAAALGIAYAFLPTGILNASLWGQVDSVLVLFMLLTFWLIDNDKFGLSVLVYSIGLLFKPQAVLFGPAMLFAAAREFHIIELSFKRKDTRDGAMRLVKGFGFLAISVGLFLLFTVIMRGDQDFDWLFEKYMTTIGSYDFATLSSFGLMGVLGGQWVASDTAIGSLPFTYGQLGTAMLVVVMVGVTALFVYLIIKNRKNALPSKWMWLLASLLFAGVVVVSSRTHERYMFPIIAMLLVTALHFKDKRLVYASIGYGLLNFINTACVLFLWEEKGVYMASDDAIFIIGSLLTVLLFIYHAGVSVKLVLSGGELPGSSHVAASERVTPQQQQQHNKAKTEAKLNRLFERKQYQLPKVRWRDIIICLLITTIYAVVAYKDLGDKEVPETYWYTDKATVYAVADLGEETEFDCVAYNSNSYSGTAQLYISADGTDYTPYTSFTLNGLDAGKWTEAGQPAKARYIRIEAQTAITLNEMVILKNGQPLEIKDTSGNVCVVDSTRGDASRLFDEQATYFEDTNTIPETEWSDGGRYLVTFTEEAQLSDVRAYVTYTEAENDLAIYVPAEAANEDGTVSPWVKMITFSSDVNITAWCYGGFIADPATLQPVRSVMIECADATHIAELAFFSNGERLTVESVTEPDGSAISPSENVFNCFDEQRTVDALTRKVSSWRISSVNDYVIIDLGAEKNIQRGYYYPSLCEGNFSIYYSVDGKTWSEKTSYSVEKSNLYYWQSIGTYTDKTARYVLVQAESRFMSLLEMGFFESEDATETIPIKDIQTFSVTNDADGAKLFDEQALVPAEGPTYMNSMYFDEIYHARTAYESANGLSIYEWTHPPLGKDIMSWCVSLMGMNPFAWRFAGTMAGVLMVPAMYFIGLLMFRKTSWATVLASLMALDGMHYVQTRIATIDSYGVLFIILMFLFMYWYYSISFYDKPLWKTFIPLGLCGICFGLGAASKWICLYAGLGLAVIFFITLFRRFSEYRLAKSALANAGGEQKKYLTHITESFTLNTCYTILFCIMFFIIIPLVIYCASYYPYWNAVGETRAWYEIIIDNQKAMFNYHSTLTATHPYQSDWYTWPIMQLPMFYYTGPSTDTTISAIYAFGNPAVWYSGLVATIIAFVLFLKRFFGGKIISVKKEGLLYSAFGPGDDHLPDTLERDTRTLLFLFIGVCCNLLPWVGISRCIFIYHYFATVPFIVMLTVYLLRHICRKRLKAGIIITVALVIIAIILFIMFRPLWTGTPVSYEFAKNWLHWFPSWFSYYFR